MSEWAVVARKTAKFCDLGLFAVGFVHDPCEYCPWRVSLWWGRLSKSRSIWRHGFTFRWRVSNRHKFALWGYGRRVDLLPA